MVELELGLGLLWGGALGQRSVSTRVRGVERRELTT